MCACSVLLHIALHVRSDWKEAANCLATVEEGEQNAAGEWTKIKILCRICGVYLWFSLVVLRTECSVCLSLMSTCVLTSWPISDGKGLVFECLEYILIALPYNSMHMLITQHGNSEVSYILQCNALLYIHNWCRLLYQTLFTTLQAIHHYIYIVFFLLQSIVLDVPHFKYFWLLIVTWELHSSVLTQWMFCNP